MDFTVIHGSPPKVETVDLVIALIVGTGVSSRSQLEPHSTLDGDLGWVAADRFDASIACQDYFGIDIEIPEALAWQTVADIARTAEAARSIAA